MTVFVPYVALSNIVLFILIITIIYFSVINSLIIYKNSWQEMKCTPLNMLYTYINPELNSESVFASCIEEKNMSINKEIENKFSNMLEGINDTLIDIKDNNREFKELYQSKYEEYIKNLSTDITNIQSDTDKMKNSTYETTTKLNNTINKVDKYVNKL